MPQPVVDVGAALVDAELQEMVERIDVCRRDVGIGREVAERVEVGCGIAALLPSELLVMFERIDVGCRNVGIVREITLGAEPRIRVAPQVTTDRVEVLPGSTPAAATSGLRSR